MRQLSDNGWRRVNELAARYGVSPGAVTALLEAVANGNGTMAQFQHPELGGYGQWMSGGMTMIGDMFNNNLKATVTNLCCELAGLLSQDLFAPAVVAQTGSFGGGYGGDWWPAGLGSPSASGGQNNVRYAYFAGTRRLAVDMGGRVAVYDTLHHQIGGVAQQQGNSNSLTFTSQYGTVRLEDLPVVS